jgi:hypothetical protein
MASVLSSAGGSAGESRGFAADAELLMVVWARRGTAVPIVTAAHKIRQRRPGLAD